MKQILSILLTCIAFTAKAQNAVYTWGDELCSYESQYDVKKITKTLLQHCEDLGLKNEYNINTTPMIFKPADIATRMRTGELEKEYAEKSAALKSLALPEVPFWQRLKTLKLREQEQVYHFSLTMFRAYKDVSVLKAYPNKSAAARRFAHALVTGGDTLLAAWKTLRNEMAARNSDPQAIIREYKQQLASPDKMSYALVDVITFGWGNSANDDIERVPDTEVEAIRKEWRKLFVKTRTLECDEP